MADLNADGWPDLVVIGYTPGSGPISVLLNDGAGGLLAPTVYDTSGIIGDAKVVDMNEDGALDLVVMDGFIDKLYVFFGDGLGGFPEQTFTGDVRGITYFATGDWNGDGHVDAALANGFDFLDVYLGDGTGTLTMSEQIQACNGPFEIISDEFNHDDRLDIALTCIAGGIDVIQIFLGDGQGSFSAGEIHTMPFDNMSPASLDLNEDGMIDIALSSAGGLYYLSGRGDGTFLEPELIPEVFSDSYPPSAGDLDGDGNLDLVVPADMDMVEINWGLGGGRFESPIRYNAPLETTASLIVDVNLDGNLDILATMKGFGSTGSPYSGVALFYGDGERGFRDAD